MDYNAVNEVVEMLSRGKGRLKWYFKWQGKNSIKKGKIKIKPRTRVQISKSNLRKATEKMRTMRLDEILYIDRKLKLGVAKAVEDRIAKLRDKKVS